MFDTLFLRPYGNSRLLDLTARFVKRHEGWGKAPNWHRGIGDSVFANRRVQDYLDRFVYPLTLNGGKIDARVVWAWYTATFYEKDSPLAIPNKLFDFPSGNEYFYASRICTFLP